LEALIIERVLYGDVPFLGTAESIAINSFSNIILIPEAAGGYGP
jgi:hypothetical protein